MKVAIFGIGLIGSAIANELDANKHEITLFDITRLKTNKKIRFCQTDYKDLSAIPWNDFDTVVLTIGLNTPDFDLMERVNCELCENIVKALKPKTKLIFFSSSAIYSSSDKTKYEDDHVVPESKYGTTKLYMENLIKKNLENYIIVRPFNVYGNYNYTFDNVRFTQKRTIIDDMIDKNKIKFLITNKKFVVRDFVSTKFIAEAVVKLVENNWNKEVVNICSGYAFDYEDYYKIIPNEEFINNNEAPHLIIGSTKKLAQLIGETKIKEQVEFMQGILND